MLKIFAILFGIIMIVVGILGFLPDFTHDGKLLDLFEVNTWHNVIHLASGFIALLCGLSKTIYCKIFFILFGLIYGFVAVWGFVQGPGMLFNMIAINTADNWLHTGIAILSLYLGLFFKSR